MNITQLSRAYLRTRPALSRCLADGVINYRALAREMERALELPGQQVAIAAALRRIATERRNLGPSGDAVGRLLLATSLRVRGNMVVATIQPGSVEAELEKLFSQQHGAGGHRLRRERQLSIIQGEDATTLIFDRSELPKIRHIVGRSILRIRDGVAQIFLIFPLEIESTPGVIATVYQALYLAGINILEEMSCWTELMVAIDEDSLAVALKELQNLVRSS